MSGGVVLVIVWCWRSAFSVQVCETMRRPDKGVRSDLPGTVLESHRYPQHALLQDIVLPDGVTLPRLEWEDNCCGLACIQTILDAEGLPVPTLDTLLAEGIESGAYDAAKGWIFRGLLELGRSYGLDGEVFTETPIRFFWEDLPAVQVAPIVSVSCNFPMNPSVKGGHLVVFRGARASNAKGEVCYCDDPSTQGAVVDEVERARFWSSFSGRALIMKSARAWQGLSSVIANKR